MTFLLAFLLFGQNFSNRGFIEYRTTAYPQEAPRDDTHIIGEALFRYEGFYKANASLQFAGSFDLRLDSHHQVDRTFDVSWLDRSIQRPLLAIRGLEATYRKGPVTLDLGKQFVRWGKTDILTPTDRFAPRDFLTVVDNDFLPITAARFAYTKDVNTLDIIWAPGFTPSRVPLLNQRWSPVPRDVAIRDLGADFPGESQVGARWNHAGSIEYSFSVYRGFNHLPSFEGSVEVTPTGQPQATIATFYPQMSMVGTDTAVPLRWLTIKGEVAHFFSNDARADEYSQFVVQLERQAGEWSFVGGYAGEVISRKGSQTGSFAPDRGLTKTLLGRAAYTIDANRSLAFEAAVRQNGDGTWVKGEYSQAFGQHWRVIGTGVIVRGAPSDFLGQYRYNSHTGVVIRYNF